MQQQQFIELFKVSNIQRLFYISQRNQQRRYYQYCKFKGVLNCLLIDRILKQITQIVIGNFLRTLLFSGCLLLTMMRKINLAWKVIQSSFQSSIKRMNNLKGIMEQKITLGEQKKPQQILKDKIIKNFLSNLQYNFQRSKNWNSLLNCKFLIQILLLKEYFNEWK
ncbi:unnamed protein product [Paramecium octaurelia]|uniref:Uncharacterized protein n=1 Tax=Paramecium octaurelia TaxID=43137 RepID=A0A8S1SMX5_PAROT|nr:unnamed protein product [Paramecium octaurelia]